MVMVLVVVVVVVVVVVFRPGRGPVRFVAPKCNDLLQTPKEKFNLADARKFLGFVGGSEKCMRFQGRSGVG